MNTRHVNFLRLDEVAEDAIEQVDGVVIVSSVEGRRPGVVQFPACGSKRTFVCRIKI